MVINALLDTFDFTVFTTPNRNMHAYFLSLTIKLLF